MRRLVGGTALATLAIAGTVRLVRSRHRRSLHPAGRSFRGTVEMLGLPDRLGSPFLEDAARHRATVRVSKGVGTRGGRLDVRGLAVRVHLAGRDLDLLLSTTGRGRLTRHLPLPRRTFDASYGTITAYRTGTGEKVYLAARRSPGGPVLGRALDEVGPPGQVVLELWRGAAVHPVGRVSWHRALPAGADAALAFNPVHNALPGLHPTGLVHGVRAFAYRWSQRWRGAVR
jgi:hypothetical protein